MELSWSRSTNAKISFAILVFSVFDVAGVAKSLPVFRSLGGQNENPVDVVAAARYKRQAAEGQCSPVIYGFRVIQQGSIPILSTEGEDSKRTVVTYADTDTRSSLGLEVYGDCLEAASELAFTEQVSCETRVGPYYVDEAQDVDSGNRTRSFMVELTGTRAPIFDRTYYLCAGIREGTLYRQSNGTQIKFELTKSTLPQWAAIVLVVMLLVLSGLFSGLNLGLMSLDPVDLKVIMQSGTEKEKQYAKIIEPIRRHGNYLLCTILLGNVIVNATLTNFLDTLTGSGAIAVIASSGGIVIFGEILPQSVCSRYGLAVGARTIMLTKFFMVVTFPLALPISFILDKILGQEIGRVFRREQLIELVQVTRGHHDMAEDELDMLAGVLEFKKKSIEEVMTPKADMFLLDEDEVLNYETLQKIQKKGHSRIPVHYHGDENDIIGVMFVKDLMFVDPDDNWPVSHIVKLYKHPVLTMDHTTTLDVMLDKFKTGVSHMALVRQLVADDENLDPFYKTTGIVTLEDIIEEIIKAEIVDETDRVRDNRTKQPVTRSEREDAPTVEMPEVEHQYVSKHLMMAAHNFLRTDFEKFFSVNTISDDKLARLLANRQVTCTLRLSDLEHRQTSLRRRRDFNDTKKDRNDPPLGTVARPSNRFLYTAGVRADYFVLILEGHVEVTLGEFDFERGPFDSFGVEVLDKRAHFSPNFSVRVISDLTYVKIPLQMYITACQLSQATPSMGRSGMESSSSMTSMSASPHRTMSAPTSTQHHVGVTISPPSNVLRLPSNSPPQEDFDMDDTSPLVQRAVSNESRDEAPHSRSSPLLSRLRPKKHGHGSASSGAGRREEMETLRSGDGHHRRTHSTSDTEV